MQYVSRVRSVSFALFFLISLVSIASAQQPAGILFKTLLLGEKSYNYAIQVPREYNATKDWPVIVFLNGAGECGTDGSKQVAVGLGTASLINAKKWPFIIIYPQKPTVQSAWEDHDAAVMAMLDQAKKDYRVDTKRLYLTGLSQGGHGTWYIGAKHADMWAAIAPICGYGDPAKVASDLKSMPIWAFHGEADRAVPVAQSHGFVDAITVAGGTPKLTTYPGVDHNSWDKAYRDEPLAEWFLEHVKK